MHAAFAGERIAGLCSVVDWMTFLSPPVMTAWRGDASGLPDWALQGWDAFFTAAPHDVADAVAAIHARPAPLGLALDACELTLVHGDLCPGNVGLARDRVVVLDWALATQGPAALDVAAFLAMVSWRAGTPPDAFLAEAQAAAGEEWDACALELALLAAFVAYGWLHADRLLRRDDPAQREREQPYWEWWIARVRHVLETTWAPAA
jgi:Ser/Thr protein kinase RdoA (MazF antagonist)